MYRRSPTALPKIALALAIAASFPGVAMAIEEPEYEVVARHGDMEVRRYAPMILAETRVETDFERAGNQAFNRLFRYISGDNRAQANIAMTAPVVQEPTSEEIAMTAPVVQEGGDDGWRVAFVLPEKYSWETAPEPTDRRVELRRVPGRTIAALRFSGTWGEERFMEHERQLRELLAEHGLEAAGKTVYARYNPPFTPWFMRRNEILIPVTRAESPAE